MLTLCDKAELCQCREHFGAVARSDIDQHQALPGCQAQRAAAESVGKIGKALQVLGSDTTKRRHGAEGDKVASQIIFANMRERLRRPAAPGCGRMIATHLDRQGGEKILQLPGRQQVSEA